MISPDVAITYTPVAAETQIMTTFDDLVEYRKSSAAEGSKMSTGELEVARASFGENGS